MSQYLAEWAPFSWMLDFYWAAHLHGAMHHGPAWRLSSCQMSALPGSPAPSPRRWLQRTTSRARPRSAPPSSLSRRGSVAPAGMASQAQHDALLEDVIRTATGRQRLAPQQEQQELAGIDVRGTRRR